MRLIKLFLGLNLCFILVIQSTAQNETIKDAAKIVQGRSEINFSYHSKYAPFPDSARLNGHDYEGKHYDYKNHYADSAVKVFKPKKFAPKKSWN